MSESTRRSFITQMSAAAFTLPIVTSIGPSSASQNGSKSKIKIGQIGTAHAHASGKLQTIRKFDDLYELVGIVEPNANRRASLESNATYKGVKWLTNEQLLNTKGLQAVAVETDVRNLVPTAQRCVSAGLHVHVDKPAGENLTEFKKLLVTAEQRKLVVQMGYMFRYNQAFQLLFQSVRDGWLGEVFEVHAVISKTVGADTRKHLSTYRGGAMFELGCHLIDALVVCLGKPDKVIPFIRRSHPDQDDLADNQLAVFEYPNATATVRSALMEVDGFRRRQFVVCGDKGTIVIRPLEPAKIELTLAEAEGEFKKGTQQIDFPKTGGRYDGDFIDLAQIIRGEKTSDYPPAHDLAVQEAVLLASGLSTE